MPNITHRVAPPILRDVSQKFSQKAKNSPRRRSALGSYQSTANASQSDKRQSKEDYGGTGIGNGTHAIDYRAESSHWLSRIRTKSAAHGPETVSRYRSWAEIIDREKIAADLRLVA
jgi:hypothetical protein